MPSPPRTKAGPLPARIAAATGVEHLVLALGIRRFAVGNVRRPRDELLVTKSTFQPSPSKRSKASPAPWHRLVPSRTTPSMSATRFTPAVRLPHPSTTAKQVGGAAERVDADTLVVPVEHVEEVGERHPVVEQSDPVAGGSAVAKNRASVAARVRAGTTRRPGHTVDPLDDRLPEQPAGRARAGHVVHHRLQLIRSASAPMALRRCSSTVSMS